MTEPPSQNQVVARVETSARAFHGRMRRAVFANKRLVATILVAGVLDAICTKGIYLLIKPLIDKLSGAMPPESVATSDLGLGDRLSRGIENLSSLL